MLRTVAIGTQTARRGSATADRVLAPVCRPKQVLAKAAHHSTSRFPVEVS
jgi:hypothetical protein